MDEQHSVLFRIEGGGETSVPARHGESLLDVAQRVGVALDAPCAGNGTCGKCRVQVLEGSVHGEASRHITPGDFAAGWRLACAAVAESNVVVRVPQTAGAYQNRIKVSGGKDIRGTAVFRNFLNELATMGLFPTNGDAPDCGISLLRAEIPPPSADDPTADRERLLREIAAGTGVEQKNIDISIYALRRLPGVLRQGNFSVTCVMRHFQSGGCDDKPRLEVLDVFPAGENHTGATAAGIAIDIGTTTVAAILVNLANGEILASGTAGNAQIRYGADVISRIIESGKPGGLERLRYAITGECLQPLVKSLCETAGIQPENIYRAALAANTTMTHLFLGVDPAHLRLEPYVPAFFETAPLKNASLGLPFNPEAEICLAPAVGSYVGGDISAGAFASMLFKQAEISLLIDLGTNGELVLGNAEFLMCCACSAGPAFEGGDISCGMRATDGAIEACTVNEETMEPSITVIGDQQPLGLCGSGLIDLIGELFRCGIINAKGKFIKEGSRVRRDEWGGVSYVVSVEGRGVALTEADIDNFIRAKAAIFSAIRTMLVSLDCGVEAIAQVYVAGGIGSGIDMAQAIRIGMLPKLPLEKYRYIGNSSLHGAFAMLNSSRAVEKIADVSRGMTYIELSSHPGYMDEFVAACFLPHTKGELFKNDA